MDNSIKSDDKIAIEQHFRVSAGPGAGKTHWLINHIKYVLQTSLRLGKTRRIACITYTNVAVTTILSRLGTSSDRVEVSTIHSFLYKHIVKPYVRFIASEYNLNHKLIDGHEDVSISRGRVINWVSTHPNVTSLKHPYTVNQLTKLEDNINALINWLSSITFTFGSNNSLKITCDRRKAHSNNRQYLNAKCLDLLEIDLVSLKEEYWKRGILDHEDVLFFSYKILKEYPFVLDILRAKFPYFYVDEFQDSNPIQVKILEMIGLTETIVGIIGDKAQSIYGFQGADEKQFETFRLKGIVNYMMLDNRRSTNQIIDVLNLLRPNFQQNKFNNVNGELPYIIIGDIEKVFDKVKMISGSEPIHTLAYKNIVSNGMKKEMGSEIPLTNLIKSLSEIDSNRIRFETVATCLKATEYAINNQFKEALKVLDKLFEENKDSARKEAIKALALLINKYNDYSDQSLLVYYSFIKDNIKPISGLRKGKALDFYTNHTYMQVAVSVNIIDDDSYHRTIHKSKGDEFDNVLVILEKEHDINFFLQADLDTNQTHRVFYVGMSRAKKRLFISIPTITSINKNKLDQTFFTINDLIQ